MLYLLIICEKMGNRVHSIHRDKKTADVWAACKMHDYPSLPDPIVVPIDVTTIGRLVEAAGLKLAPLETTQTNVG